MKPLNWKEIWTQFERVYPALNGGQKRSLNHWVEKARAAPPVGKEAKP